VLADVAAVVQAQADGGAPLFVMGHSMGGAIALALASTPAYAELARVVRGWLMESPYIALPAAAAPPALKVAAGRLAAWVAPRMQLAHRIPPAHLTRDAAVAASLAADKLCFNVGTLETLAAMMERADALASGRYRLNDGVRALWIAHGTADRATDFRASELYCAAQTTVADRTFKPYTDWSHQLHADLPETRPVFARDVGDWVLARCGSIEGEAKL
jgi:acylglycerol lipase